jgi:25S rRNA (uracil2843-N3)-methyltransferase
MAPARKQKDRSGRAHQMGLQQPATSDKAGTQSAPENDSASAHVEMQQTILDMFRRAFPFDQSQQDLKATIQEVKGYLFQRDFSRAFAKPEYLDAYALRWSASRALGYSSIFFHGDLQQVWSMFNTSANSVPNGTSLSSSSPETTSSPLKPPLLVSACRLVCIGGGGGAEVAASAAAALQLLPHSTKMSVHVVDIADWAASLQKLENAFCTPPPLSAYASGSAKAANKTFVARESFGIHFSQQDILAISAAELRDLMQQVHLCTLMFTLNELFSASVAKATAFLLALTQFMSPDSWLLVVDSPGSYSEVKLGKGDDAKTKQYPMAGEGENRKWKKVVSDDSRWFRLNQQALKYPIELENMRYQIHLYQRVQVGGEAT